MTSQSLRVIRFAASFLCLVSSITVGVLAQQALIKTSERQAVMGPFKVESLSAGRARIQFWLNTPTYLAKEITLESASFDISRDADGSMTIKSSGPVSMTGLTLGHDINNAVMIRNPERTDSFTERATNLLTWDRDFKLRIQPDGTLDWFCCPRQP